MHPSLALNIQCAVFRILESSTFGVLSTICSVFVNFESVPRVDLALDSHAPPKRPIFFARFEYLQLALSSCHRVTTSSDGSRRCPRINFHWQVVHAIMILSPHLVLCLELVFRSCALQRFHQPTEGQDSFGFTFNVNDILRSVICRKYVCVFKPTSKTYLWPIHPMLISHPSTHTLPFDTNETLSLWYAHHPRPFLEVTKLQLKKKLRQCSSFSCFLLLTSQSIVASPTYHTVRVSAQLAIRIQTSQFPL